MHARLPPLGRLALVMPHRGRAARRGGRRASPHADASLQPFTEAAGPALERGAVEPHHKAVRRPCHNDHQEDSLENSLEDFQSHLAIPPGPISRWRPSGQGCDRTVADRPPRKHRGPARVGRSGPVPPSSGRPVVAGARRCSVPLDKGADQDVGGPVRVVDGRPPTTNRGAGPPAPAASKIAEKSTEASANGLALGANAVVAVRTGQFEASPLADSRAVSSLPASRTNGPGRSCWARRRCWPRQTARRGTARHGPTRPALLRVRAR